MSYGKWISRLNMNRSKGGHCPRANPRRKADVGRPGFLTEALENRRLLTAVITTLTAFNDTNGISPESALISDSSGNLYGTTMFGGANNINKGTVYEIAAGSGTVTTLVNFNGANGQNPDGTLIFDANGNLYGTTMLGGNGNGTVFEVAAGTRALTTLVTFNGVDGQSPEGGLIPDGQGNLYGTTYYGGTSNQGTVFEISAGSHTVTTLVNFNSANGQNPIGSLISDNSGNLFGATVYGTSFDDGTIFEVAAGSHNFSTLATFNGANGQNPEGGLAFDLTGDLFGTTFRGGANSDGNIFKIASGSNTLTTVLDFNNTNGQNPAANLIGDGLGNLYGTTSGGGGNNDGTIFKVVTGSNAFSNVASFNDTNGAFPLGGLIIDGDGNLYGTTSSGGPGNAGTVFKFGVAIGPAAKVVFTPEPGNALPGQAISPGVSVAVEDASGNVENTNTSTVTLSLGSGPTGGTLGGTLTATAVNGIATFNGVTLSSIGSYTLTAKDGALTSATSTPIYVVPAVGNVDTASMNAITGWASDPANPTGSINIQVVITGGPNTQTISADGQRGDLTAFIGSATHGFYYATPILAVGTHTVNVYAVLGNGSKVLLGTKTVTSQNSLFDEHYYLTEYPDVAAAVAAGTFATGYNHYIKYGQFEGRSPTPYWNEAWYLQNNPDVAAAVKAGTITSGFMHYYLYGQYENRPGVLYFNTSYYLAKYSDVSSAVTSGAITSAFEHFELYGQYEDRAPSLYFSSTVYDADNSDILPFITGEPLGSDYEHFVEFGQYEGRIASNFYNEQVYLANNADVASAVTSGAFKDGYIHWLEYGQYESRKAV